MADGVAADLDPAVPAVRGLEGVDGARRRVGEEGLHVREHGRAVLLQRQEVVAAAPEDGRRDLHLGADRVDRHQGAFQRQPLQEERDGGDLVRLAGHRLLPEHQPLAARPGGDEVQGTAPLAPGVGAARGLAVDGDQVGLGLAQALDPSRKARLEQLGIERGEHLAQRVVARNAVPVGQEAAQEGQVLPAPEPDLGHVVGPGQGGAEQQEQDLGQRVEHLGPLPWVLQRSEVVEQRGAGGGAVHGRLHPTGRLPARTKPGRKLTSRSSDRPGRVAVTA